MSLDKAAKHLEAQGRNGDSMLVHMTPGEVQSLQTIAKAHGGSLTINPATGLAEAGFLKNLLPTLAGIGLSFIPGVGPLMAAGMVGGYETLRTGNIGKGLMAGLGAYGGAGLTQGLASAGSAGVMEGAQQSALNAGQAVGTEAATAVTNPSVYTGDLAGFTPDQVSQITAQRSAVMATPGIESAGQTTFSNVGKGIGSLGTETGRSLAYQGMPTGTLPAVASTAAQAMTPEQKPLEVKSEPSSGKYISKDFRAYEPQRPNPYYRPMGLGYTGYAEGGQVDPLEQMAPGGLAAIQGVRDGYGATQTMDGNIPQFQEGGSLRMKRMQMGEGIFKDTNPNTANLGAAEAAEYYVRNTAKRSKVPYTKMPKTNIEDLGEIKVGPAKAAGGSIGGYSDGGRMLKGPGDGMSDSIPATIGNKQPARLADGEFVVPADVVSHLGNGSTDAGAKRLYAMMDKVRQARTGNKKQGKKIKPEKYMPA